MASAGKRGGFLSSNRFFLFKGLVFTMLAITVWLLINARNLQEFLDTYYKRNREAEKIAELRERIRTLENQQRGLRANGFEAEKQVRERFGFHLPGEKVIHLVPESEKAKVLQAQEAATSATLPAPGTAVSPDAEATDDEKTTRRNGGQNPVNKSRPRQ
jgi:hypothetical protein